MPALTCAAAALASLAVTTIAIAPAPAAAAPPSPAVAHPSSVVLPTGEHLAVRWYGATPRVSQGAGERSQISVATVGTHVYAVPFEAAPYIGSALDRSLFDVSELAAKQGARGTGRVPVSLTFAGPAVDVPGVQITSQSGTHASGYLTNQSTAAFGAALRDRLHHAPADARRAGTPVPGLTHLTLDGPNGGIVQPNFAQVTLTVKLIPPAGQTLLGAAVLITNIDDSRKYFNLIGIGPDNYAKVSLPKGDYALVGAIATGAADGFGAFYAPIVPDYALTTNNQSVTLDARKATAPPTFSTPRPAGLVGAGVDIVATDTLRRSQGGMGFGYFGEDEMFVQPVRKPKHGVLEFDAFEHRLAAPAGERPFDYHLTGEWLAGIPADLHRTVAPNELARIEDHLYGSDAVAGRHFGRGPVYPDHRGGIDFNEVASPTLIDYVYGPPDVKWTAIAFQSPTPDNTSSENLYSVPVSYRPGNTYRVSWFRGSLAPGFSSKPTFPGSYCVACRTTDQMALTISSEQDADPNHFGAAYGAATGVARFQVFRDGTSIVDAADTDQVMFPVPPQSHAYRIEDTIDRGKLGFTTSTNTKSVYTVRSSSTSGKPVPAGWDCVAPGNGACTVLPLLTANVPLPTTHATTMPAGTSSFVVSVGHLPAATKSAISKLTFATSLDGTTFSPARVIDLGNGRYQVTLTNAPGTAGHQITIRVHAEDAAGATLTQTVTNAYSVTGS